MTTRRAPVSRWFWIPMLVLGPIAWGADLETRFLPVIGVSVIGAMMLLDRIVAHRRTMATAAMVHASDSARADDVDPMPERSTRPISRFWWFPIAGVAVAVAAIDLDLAQASSLVLFVFSLLLLLDRVVGCDRRRREHASPLMRHLWLVLLLIAVVQSMLRFEWWVPTLAVIGVGALDVALERSRPKRRPAAFR